MCAQERERERERKREQGGEIKRVEEQRIQRFMMHPSLILNHVAYLATKSTSVFSVLSDFHFLDLLAHGSTITSTVFTNDSDFLCSFGLGKRTKRMRECHPMH